MPHTKEFGAKIKSQEHYSFITLIGSRFFFNVGDSFCSKVEFRMNECIEHDCQCLTALIVHVQLFQELLEKNIKKYNTLKASIFWKSFYNLYWPCD